MKNSDKYHKFSMVFPWFSPIKPDQFHRRSSRRGTNDVHGLICPLKPHRTALAQAKLDIFS